ncbi:YadA-like family protein, partial [Neisseria sp.]|uniref:YadA-like family protein n=1 Tax=Neisseria sp. TaxID=192066 RepID=UPI00289CD9D2
GNPVSLSENGLNNGGNVISGVANGVADNDAVNMAQLNAAAAAAANKVAAGQNIEVTEAQNADGSTTYTVATAKDVSFDSVTAGSGANQVVLNDSGVNVGGNTYISDAGLNANGKKVSNVAAGDIASGSTDAVNGGQLYNTANSVANVFGGNAGVNPDGTVSMTNVGGTGANNINDAISAVNQAAVQAKTTVTAGDNMVVTPSTNADGSTNYTVATAKDVSFDSVTAGSGANQVVLNDSGVNVGGNTYISDAGLNANGKKVSNVAAGDIASGSTDAVNGGQLYNTANSVANVFGGNAGVNPDGTVSMTNVGGTGANNINDAISAVNQAAVQAKTTVAAGDNIVVTPSTNADGSTNYTVATAKDLTVDSVTAGNTVINNDGLTIANGPSITSSGVNAGGQKVTNVADGEVAENSKDAVNGGQLYQTNQAINNLGNAVVNMGGQMNKRMDTIEADAKAGTAAAMAVAGLPQAYLPGKNMMAVAGSTYRGEQGYAVGYSGISDNGNWIIKGTATGNSRGQYGATAGVGYQW